MTLSKDARVLREIAALDALDRQTLRARWQSTFGHTASSRLSRPLMLKALAHDIQTRAYGGLSRRTIRALKAAVRSDATATSTRPLSRGTRLVREWNGVVHEVEVLDDGYLWHGQRYRSLSAVALAITGTKWSGPRFFGTRKD
jgi:hypothetical protein